MKKRHKKRDKARSMLSKWERENGVSPFDSLAWRKRSNAIQKRLATKKLSREKSKKGL